MITRELWHKVVGLYDFNRYASLDFVYMGTSKIHEQLAQHISM